MQVLAKRSRPVCDMDSEEEGRFMKKGGIKKFEFNDGG